MLLEYYCTALRLTLVYYFQDYDADIKNFILGIKCMQRQRVTSILGSTCHETVWIPLPPQDNLSGLPTSCSANLLHLLSHLFFQNVQLISQGPRCPRLLHQVSVLQCTSDIHVYDQQVRFTHTWERKKQTNPGPCKAKGVRKLSSPQQRERGRQPFTPG